MAGLVVLVDSCLGSYRLFVEDWASLHCLVNYTIYSYQNQLSQVDVELRMCVVDYQVGVLTTTA